MVLSHKEVLSLAALLMAGPLFQQSQHVVEKLAAGQCSSANREMYDGLIITALIPAVNYYLVSIAVFRLQEATEVSNPFWQSMFFLSCFNLKEDVLSAHRKVKTH